MKINLKHIVLTTILGITNGVVQGQNCPSQSIVPVSDAICPNNDPYVCVFEDNFNGTSLNLDNWVPRSTVIRDPHHISEKQWYSPNNIEVSNGTLKIKAKWEPGNRCYDIWENNATQHYCEDFNYTSGEIDSKYKFGAGVFEIRCKIPKGKGFFPAFWTFGNPWSEIDVFEFTNKYFANGNCDLDQSVRQQMLNTHNDFDGNGGEYSCSSIYSGPDFSADFHTFSVVWTQFYMQWYVDGAIVRTKIFAKDILGQEVGCSGFKAMHQYIVDKSFPRINAINVIADLAIQSGNHAPDANTPFPSAFEIDYIRCYKQANCSSVLNITNTSQLNLSSTYFNSVVGSIINMNTNVVLDNTKQLEAIASDKIVLGPGFSANTGSYFHGRINPNICSGGASPAYATTLDNTQAVTYVDPIKQEVPTGVREIAEKKTAFFPNPTNGKFMIEFVTDKQAPYQIIVKDIQGNVIYTAEKIEDSKLDVDISNFSAGMYFINIIDNNNQVYSNKLIKN